MKIVVRFKAAAGHEAVVKRLAKIQNMPITANQLRHPAKQTNAPIGARKCNFPAAFLVYYGRQTETNQQTNRRTSGFIGKQRKLDSLICFIRNYSEESTRKYITLLRSCMSFNVAMFLYNFHTYTTYIRMNYLV